MKKDNSSNNYAPIVLFGVALCVIVLLLLQYCERSEPKLVKDDPTSIPQEPEKKLDTLRPPRPDNPPSGDNGENSKPQPPKEEEKKKKNNVGGGKPGLPIKPAPPFPEHQFIVDKKNPSLVYVTNPNPILADIEIKMEEMTNLIKTKPELKHLEADLKAIRIFTNGANENGKLLTYTIKKVEWLRTQTGATDFNHPFLKSKYWEKL